MEDNFEFIGCNEDDVISSGSAMFKSQKLKGKIKSLFNKRKLGEELTNSLKNENLYLNIPAINREHIGKKGVITGSLDRILYEKWFDEGIPCEILKLRSGGWKKGKVKINLEISIEFCPDEPEIEEIKEPESPLDDLRRMINDATS
ncbi:KGK domain-containing protein [Anabaena cylindrica UHCC 0172]|uniref:KGK domain-containing protein n=1 Tax=Anabaena cylindrica TaxID=1165 RepID=UPI002B2006DE|nr:KGK domain-containing protein [Anabaena cylindrica]MEA5554299.1 KGK domain-containing protein [Anabaena cylindrica UHCC 0172]